MTTELEVFSNEQYSIRTVAGEDGETRFVAADIARALEYRDAADAIRLLEDDEKGTQTVRTLGGEQEMSVITEAGLYRLLAVGRKEKTKAFQRWLFHEVLPSIRKTGQYAIEQSVTPKPVPQKFESVALAQYQERARRRRAKELLARGLHENPVTGSLEPLPGVVPEAQLAQKMDGIIQDRYRTAKKSNDSAYQTPAEAEKHMPWMRAIGER